MKAIFVVFLCLIVCATLCDSKSMWGSRRKKDKREEVAPKPKAISSTVDTTSKRRKQAIHQYKSPIVEKLDVDEGGDGGVEGLFEAYMKIVEDLLATEEFDTLVNPETVANMLNQIPGLSENQELSDLFASPDFTNPKLLKKTIRKGMKMLREYSGEIISILNDPVKLAATLEQLPPEVTEILEGLKSGDTTAIENFISSLSGVDESQKNMLLSLLAGNTAGLTDQIQQVLGSPDQVEAARLQFLESPELAVAMGISLDVLESPEQFAQLMASGIEELSNLDGSGGDGEQEEEQVEEETVSLSGRRSVKAGINRSGFKSSASRSRKSSQESELERLKKKFLGDFNRAE